MLTTLDHVVNFQRRLGQKKGAAREQDDIPPRDPVIEHAERNSGESDQPGDPEQQGNPHHQSADQTDRTTEGPALFRQLVCDDRHENHVVDPENDLHQRQGQKTDPDRRLHQQVQGTLP